MYRFGKINSNGLGTWGIRFKTELNPFFKTPKTHRLGECNSIVGSCRVGFILLTVRIWGFKYLTVWR